MLTHELKMIFLSKLNYNVLKIYIDHINKRKTRATEAKRKGLEPLAKWLLQSELDEKVQTKAQTYLNEEKSVEEAIQGAQDIIAEQISDNPKYRSRILKMYINKDKL